jgi:hypothetical protein
MRSSFLYDLFTENSYYYSLGRNAMYAAITAMQLGTDDEILSPAWDCDGALQPFREKGCKITFYKIKPETFDVDLEHIKSLMSDKTKLLHIINYFGIPQDWDSILKIKEEYSLYILEDNAYSLFSEYKNTSLGRFGDFAIFSIRKCLPVPDGGLLVNNSKLTIKIRDNESHFLHKIDRSKAKQILFQTIKNYIVYTKWFNKYKPKKKSIDYPFPLYSDNINEFPNGERSHEGREFFYRKERPMSRFSQKKLKFYSTRLLKKMRADYVRKYYSIVQGINYLNTIKVLHPKVDENVMPYCVFLIVNNRDNLFYHLLSKNYPVMVWPSLSESILSGLALYPEVEYLGKRLIQINIKSYLSVNYYQRMTTDINIFLNSRNL